MLPVNGKTAIVRTCTFYSMLFEQRYGFKPILKYPMLGKVLKPVLDQFSEYQVALLILVFMNWQGADNNSDFERRKLQDKCYPLNWMPMNINAYLAFAKNYLGIKFEDENEVKEYVTSTLRGLKLRFNEVENA